MCQGTPRQDNSKRRVAWLPGDSLLSVPEFCEAPATLTMLTHECFYYLQQDASIICSKTSETPGKVSPAHIIQAEESSVDSSLCSCT